MSIRFILGPCPACDQTDMLGPYGDEGAFICKPCSHARNEPLADEAAERVRSASAKAAAQLRRLA